MNFEQPRVKSPEDIKPKEESPKIKLPEDPEIVQKLQGKLEGYKKRLEELKKGKYIYESLKERSFVFADTNYKIAVLERVLNDGEVSTFEISRELDAKDGQFNLRAFNNACTVIDDYCKTSGKNNEGGTGF